MQTSTILGSIFAIILTASSVPAATLTFTLDQDGCSGTCGTPPFGTVTLTDNGTGTSAFVTVTETLASSENFAGTGAGQALEFNVNGPITINNISPSASFGIGPAPATASTFGSFLESIACTACQGGQGPTGPLSFDVSSATGVTVADFIANGGGYYFASDILGNNGNTGNVATMVGAGSPTSEPGTLVMILSGLALVGGGALRIRKGSPLVLVN